MDRPRSRDSARPANGNEILIATYLSARDAKRVALPLEY
jgi:hypothetical protein